MEKIVDKNQISIINKTNIFLESINIPPLNDEGNCNGIGSGWLVDIITSKIGLAKKFFNTLVKIKLCPQESLKNYKNEIILFAGNTIILQNPRLFGAAHQGSLASILPLINEADLIDNDDENPKFSFPFDKAGLIEYFKNYGVHFFNHPEKGHRLADMSHTTFMYSNNDKKHKTFDANGGEKLNFSIEELVDNIFYCFRDPVTQVIPEIISFLMRSFKNKNKNSNYTSRENLNFSEPMVDREKIMLTLLKNDKGEIQNDRQATDRTTNLLAAVANNDAKLVRMLLEIGDDPNKRNLFGSTALGHALNNDYHDIIKLLLGSAPTYYYPLQKRIQIQPDEVETFLSIAEKGYLKTIKIFLNYDRNNHVLTLEDKARLIKIAGTITDRMQITESNSDKDLIISLTNYLKLQADGYDYAIVDGLTVKNGKFTEEMQNELLDKCHDVVKLLLKAVTTPEHLTQKRIQLERDDSEVFLFIVGKGYSKTVETVLNYDLDNHFLTLEDKADLIKITGTIIDRMQITGDKFDKDLVLSLINYFHLQADGYDDATVDGLTVKKDTFTEEMKNEFLKVIIKSVKKIDITNDQGNTFLATYATLGNTEIVKLLLEENAEITRNQQGETPLMLAASRGNIAMLELLLTSRIHSNGDIKEAAGYAERYEQSGAKLFLESFMHFNKPMMFGQLVAQPSINSPLHNNNNDFGLYQQSTPPISSP